MSRGGEATRRGEAMASRGGMMCEATGRTPGRCSRHDLASVPKTEAKSLRGAAGLCWGRGVPVLGRRGAPGRNPPFVGRGNETRTGAWRILCLISSSKTICLISSAIISSSPAPGATNTPERGPCPRLGEMSSAAQAACPQTATSGARPSSAAHARSTALDDARIER